MKKSLTALFLTVLTVFISAAPAGPGDPRELVDKKFVNLQRLVRTKPITAKNLEKIKSMVNDIFDFQMLGKRALPKETWESLDKANKTLFISEFRRMVENVSIKKPDIYLADSCTYDPTYYSTNKKDAEVTAHVTYKGREFIHVYKFSLIDNKWHLWDLVIDDLSTARTYREQFAKILETKSFAELMSIIKKKADTNN